VHAPTRESILAQAPTRYRSGRNFTKADILLWDHEPQRLAIKDYAARPAWLRNTLGRLLVRREVRAYRRLQGVAGIPRLWGRIDAFAFAVEFVPGRDLSHFKAGEIPGSFFRLLLELLDRVHRAGVAQGDLHHRDVLVGPGPAPFLVDFSTAVFLSPGSGPLGRRLFGAACGADRRAALKLAQRFAPGTLAPGEVFELEHPPAWYRYGKRMRAWWRGGQPRHRR
jgi:hypothetical protein